MHVSKLLYIDPSIEPLPSSQIIEEALSHSGEIVSVNVCSDPFTALELLNTAVYDIIITSDTISTIGVDELAKMLRLNGVKAVLVLLRNKKGGNTFSFDHILDAPYCFDHFRELMEQVLHQRTDITTIEENEATTDSREVDAAADLEHLDVDINKVERENTVNKNVVTTTYGTPYQMDSVVDIEAFDSEILCEILL